MRSTTLPTNIVLILWILELAGCGSSDGLPSNLPPLPPPPEPPKAIEKIKPTSAELTLTDTKGVSLSRSSISSEETVQVSFKFDWPEHAPRPKAAIIQVGKRKSDGRFFIHNEKVKRLSNETGPNYQVKLEIRAPVLTGDFQVHAIIDGELVADVPLKVRAATPK